MLKTSSCLSETISFHFACRPLRATSVHVTAALASYPVSPRRLSKLRRGLPGPGKQQPSRVPIARPQLQSAARRTHNARNGPWAPVLM